MFRLATWPTALAAPAAFLALLACASGPPPDEGKFKTVVAQMLVKAANRSGGTVDGDDPVKTIVFDEDSFSPELQGAETMVKQGLEDLGIAWVDVDLRGDARNLPGEWTMAGQESTLKFNRSHFAVHVRIQGSGREREVEWGLVCGPACGYGQRVRLVWSGDTWTQTEVAQIRY